MYRNRKPSTRRDRRKVSQRSRQRQEGTDKTLVITLGVFAVVSLVILVLIAIALQPG